MECHMNISFYCKRLKRIEENRYEELVMSVGCEKECYYLEISKDTMRYDYSRDCKSGFTEKRKRITLEKGVYNKNKLRQKAISLSKKTEDLTRAFNRNSEKQLKEIIKDSFISNFTKISFRDALLKE